MDKRLLNLLPPGIQRLIRRWYYLRKFSRSSAHDEKDLGLVRTLVTRGDVAFDIGANFGLYTKVLAECVGEKGQVFAFEPVPHTFDVLANNVRHSHLRQVTPLPYAASSETGVATISIPAYADGGENTYEASLEASGSGTQMQIETVRLDEQFASLPRLDFVKLDVEGHEPAVLEGMQVIIEKHHPSFLIEINDGFAEGSTGRTVRTMMLAKGYSMWYFDGIELRPSSGNEDGVNYLFTYKQ